MSTCVWSLRNYITHRNMQKEMHLIFATIITTPYHKIFAMTALFSYSQDFIMQILRCI